MGRNTLIKKGLVIAVILLFMGMSVVPSTGTVADKKFSMPTNYDGDTLYVGGDGSGNYTRIQDAIDNASDGDTVFVFDDSSPYYEYVIVNKSINLLGENRNTTVINSDVVKISANSVNISSFTIQNRVDIKSDNNTIFGNIFTNGSNINLGRGSNSNIISNNIFVESRGIFMDGSSNNIVTGNNIDSNEHGLYVFSDSNNNIIANNTIDNITEGHCGINLQEDSNNNNISGNIIISNNGVGISLERSSSNIIISNSLFNGGLSIWLDGSYQNTISNNTVNGKPLVYLEEKSDIVIDDAGQVVLNKCDNITIQDLEFSNICTGIILSETDNCLITGNSVSNCNGDGICLQYSSNNDISENIISNTDWGISLMSSCNNTISFNTITDSRWEGITIVHGSDSNDVHMNYIVGNRINDIGIHLMNAESNNISFNTITFFVFAIVLESSYDNIFYMNNITNCIWGIEIWGMPDNRLTKTTQNHRPNIIKNNNFKNVIIKGIVKFFTYFDNHWEGNYWGRPRILPKFIIGLKMLTENLGIPSKIQIDWRPALKPYDIPMGVW